MRRTARTALATALVASVGAPLAMADPWPVDVPASPVAVAAVDPIDASPDRPDAAVIVLATVTDGDWDAALAPARRVGRDAGLDVWTAVAVPATPASGASAHDAAMGMLRRSGFSGRSGAVVVVGEHSSAPAALDVAEQQALGGLVLVAPPTDDVFVSRLRAIDEPVVSVAGELDLRSRVTNVVTRLGGDRRTRAAALSGADAPDLRGTDTGLLIGGALVSATTGNGGPLGAQLARHELTHVIQQAARSELGGVCEQAQHHTADLATLGVAATVTDRHWDDLMRPDVDEDTDGDGETIADGNFGGFLYDKANVAARDVEAPRPVAVTTNSLTVAARGGAEESVPLGRATGALPVGADEVMCKTKSRDALDQAAHDDWQRRIAQPAPTCAGFTRDRIEATLAAVSDEAGARFAGLVVADDDMKRAGPEWVFAPLELRPLGDASGAWHVRSPALVTQLSDTNLDPEFAGNHYCKVVSPLRLLELVLIDAVRPGV